MFSVSVPVGPGLARRSLALVRRGLTDLYRIGVRPSAWMARCDTRLRVAITGPARLDRVR